MKSFNILLVEDNRADAFLIERGFKDNAPHVHIEGVEDGDEALNYLNKKNNHINAADPDLILLDLNLPRIDGISVLKEIKSNPKFRKIPVVVLTSSNAENDIKASYENYASGYIVKPSGFEKIIQMISALEKYWFQLVKSPRFSSAEY